MKNRSLAFILLAPALLLLVPLAAMPFTDEMNWDLADFAVAWTLMAGVGGAYRFVTRRRGDVAYRAAVGLALATAFILIWANLAVGIIGSEDHPANAMYFAVLAIGGVGCALARGEPNGMARALFATALAQVSIPVIALIVWRPPVTAGVMKVFVFNFFFALLFIGSAGLFRQAARKQNASGTDARA